ncbi:MAG: cupin domain-containing protein [Firmicutes bacterium]|nr:cupin domain-containing protein [Bacillota bacterium]
MAAGKERGGDGRKGQRGSGQPEVDTEATQAGAERRLSGPGVQDVLEFQKEFRRRKSGVAMKGNIWRPVLTVEYPGYPLSFPINIFQIPERKANYGLSVIKPGYGYPREIHDTVDDVYLIVRGKGKVDLDDQTYDAEEFDVFHVIAGTWHRLYNPSENDQDFCVWLVEMPGAPFERKAADWNLSPEFLR